MASVADPRCKPSQKNSRLPFWGWVAVLLPLLAVLSPATLRAGDAVRLVSDPETTHLLDQLSEPLVRAAGMPEGSIRFHVILDDTLNAFALPNLHIVFNSGLVLAAQSRDELAGVMAHELAHLAAGHHAQLNQANKEISLRTMITTAVGLAAGIASGHGELTQAAVMGSQAAGRSALLEVLRRKETQADRLAVHYLSQAGFDPQGMGAFLSRIAREQRLATLPPPYLLTHPISTQRVAEVQDQAHRTPVPNPRPATPENQQLLRVQAKLEAGAQGDAISAVERFTKRARLLGADLPTRYGLALAHRYAGQLTEAEGALDALMAELPGDPFFHRERGLVRLERGALDGAAADLRAALEQLPENPDLLYHLARVLNEQGNLEGASLTLFRLTASHPQEARAFHLLGVVEGRRQRPGYSHMALARYYRLLAERKTALWHYQEAIRAFPDGSRERQAASAERERLEREAS